MEVKMLIDLQCEIDYRLLLPFSFLEQSLVSVRPQFSIYPNQTFPHRGS